MVAPLGIKSVQYSIICETCKTYMCNFVRLLYRLRASCSFNTNFVQLYHLFKVCIVYRNIHCYRTNAKINHLCIDLFYLSTGERWQLFAWSNPGHPGHGGWSLEDPNGSVGLGSPTGGQLERSLRHKKNQDSPNSA